MERKSFTKKMLKEHEENKEHKYSFYDAERRVLYEHVIVPLREGEYGAFFSNSIFIPATRSFFANLQKNIFTFLATNLDIDPFLKEFGRLYESAKRMYRQDLFNDKEKEIISEMAKSLDLILNGDYEYKDEQDWIVSKGNKTNLANASSGQQESLPMLLVLSVIPLLSSRKGNYLFIEEPEAHLFPTSQGHIVSIISLLYSKASSNFFITSHSPYILSAINNFILANDTVCKGLISPKEFTKLNGSGLPIDFNDVSAYTIENGHSKNIVDEELRIIGGAMLDDISEHFQNVMNSLLELDD